MRKERPPVGAAKRAEAGRSMIMVCVDEEWPAPALR